MAFGPDNVDNSHDLPILGNLDLDRAVKIIRPTKATMIKNAVAGRCEARQMLKTDGPPLSERKFVAVMALA